MPSQPIMISYLVLMSLIVCVVIPYETWCFIQIKQNWTKPYMKRRRPELVLWLVIMMSLFPLLLIPAQFLIDFYIASQYVTDYSFFKQENVYTVSYVILVWAILFPANILMNNLGVIRIWLLYYDLQVSKFIKNKEWQMAIDPTIESKNWFINPIHQRRFRDCKKLIRVAMIGTVIEELIFIVIAFLFDLFLVAFSFSILSVLIKVML